MSVTLDIHNEMRIRHIVVCGLSWFYNTFTHYLINGKIFGKRLLNIQIVFWISLQLVYETFHILRRNDWNMNTIVYRSSCKVPVIHARIEFYRQIFEKYSHKIPRKSVRWESSCSMQKDGRIDRHDEANSHFRNFANSPKNKRVTLQ